MTNFITMVTRVARELRRSNIESDIRNAINDAISEAAANRFYFNEMRALTFPTVANQEYYPDQGVTELDVMYWYDGNSGNSRRNLYIDDNNVANSRAAGNIITGQLTNVSRRGTEFRLYPIPIIVFSVYFEGFGKLTPWPLVNDADTNDWMKEGERYIRALAKRNIQRDLIKDYSDALVLEAIAEDYKTVLMDKTTQRLGTGRLFPTNF